VICFIALALAILARRWQRVELTRISYGALVFVTVKLLVEDLRNPRLEFIAASIFLVATTLLVVPRLSRLQRRS
jgi:endo-1,4-beta-D-glucanase Y